MSDFKFYVGITDRPWYEQLRQLSAAEVNFWRPSGKGFGAVTPGQMFLFKLHSPDDYIVGGGVFTRALRLPVSLAWDIFKEQNGTSSREELTNAIGRYRRTPLERGEDPDIGCILLNEPFFFPREQWIPVSTHWWSRAIQTGKTFTTANSAGKALWERVMDNLRQSNPFQVAEEEMVYGESYMHRGRLGQASFRAHIIEAYSRRCAVTGEKVLPTLQAAHIQPYSVSQLNRVDNGLLLRSDVHQLFDHGLITVTPDYQIEVSKEVKERYNNGKEYYKFHGERLQVLPRAANEKPAEEFLGWHNSEIYLG